MLTIGIVASLLAIPPSFPSKSISSWGEVRAFLSESWSAYLTKVKKERDSAAWERIRVRDGEIRRSQDALKSFDARMLQRELDKSKPEPKKAEESVRRMSMSELEQMIRDHDELMKASDLRQKQMEEQVKALQKQFEPKK